MATTVTVTETVTITVVVTVQQILGLLTDLFFQHHSVGRDLIDRSTAIEDFNALGYDLWDFDYNYLLVRLNGVNQDEVYPRVPSDNTDYSNWGEIWTNANWLSDALEHEVIMLKACYPNSLIETNDELEANKVEIAAVRDVADDNPTKLFIMLTHPPLTPSQSGGADSAQRARDLANWMVASLSDGRDNLVVFDLFDELAVADGEENENTLKSGWETSSSDSHPNATADATVGPIWVDFVDAAIKAFG